MTMNLIFDVYGDCIETIS